LEREKGVIGPYRGIEDRYCEEEEGQTAGETEKK
jgi:hypothetical protein